MFTIENKRSKCTNPKRLPAVPKESRRVCRYRISWHHKIDSLIPSIYTQRTFCLIVSGKL